MAALAQPAADALRPHAPGGMGQGALWSLLAHALLLTALTFAVSWRSQPPPTFSAELWAAMPQAAAPRAAEVPPPPAPPQPAPAARAAPPAPAAPPQPDAQIAIEKARQAQLERERQDQLERARIAREKSEKAERDRAERAQQERAARDKARLEKEAQAKAVREQAERAARARAEAEQRDAQRQQAAEDARLAKQREENLRRMMGQAGATGAPGSQGTAARDAAPSASYAGKLIARVKPNILLTDPVTGKPAAEVEVRAAPGGTILSRRLVKSSGNKTWDEAVLRAIDRTAELPRDEDGRVPPVVLIVFTP
jgi:colicin import membrane protein